jgi:hypothetical protein
MAKRIAPLRVILFRSPAHPAREYVRIAVVFGAYFAAGKLGLAAPFTSGNISPVWPASGVALGALLLCGYGDRIKGCDGACLHACWLPRKS